MDFSERPCSSGNCWDGGRSAPSALKEVDYWLPVVSSVFCFSVPPIGLVFTAGCEEEFFLTCASGRCVPWSFKCDGKIDCEVDDKTDEINCTSKQLSKSYCFLTMYCIFLLPKKPLKPCYHVQLMLGQHTRPDEIGTFGQNYK